MNKSQKAEQVDEIGKLLSKSNGVLLVDYSKINVADINKLRNELRSAGLTYKVFKNTMFKKAIESSGKYNEFSTDLAGMIGAVFTEENYVSAAKVVKKYYDLTGKFALKGCYIEGQYYAGDKLDALASMPTKDEVISGIIGSIAAPASGIVGAINAVMRDVVCLIDEIAKQKAA